MSNVGLIIAAAALTVTLLTSGVGVVTMFVQMDARIKALENTVQWRAGVNSDLRDLNQWKDRHFYLFQGAYETRERVLGTSGPLSPTP